MHLMIPVWLNIKNPKTSVAVVKNIDDDSAGGRCTLLLLLKIQLHSNAARYRLLRRLVGTRELHHVLVQKRLGAA